MQKITSVYPQKKLAATIVIFSLSLLISLNTFSQVSSNPTVLNSMSLSNITPVSATLSWLYSDQEFDSAPAYHVYSRTLSETLYQLLVAKVLNTFQTGSVKSETINITNLQPGTTYTWFLNVVDEARGMSEPLLMSNYNNGIFIGLSFLTTATYQYITFTTPNTDGTGGTTPVLTTVSGSIIPVNQPPVANAGPDITLSLPANNTTINGLNSTDSDGGIQMYEWAKVAGPTTFTANQWWTSILSLSNLMQGTYTFSLVVRDSRGGFSQDFVNVIVGGGANLSPTVNAGPDQTITLPTNSVALTGIASDPDGTINSYYWAKTAGPATYGISNPSGANTSLLNLQQGSYTFQLTVTDNIGATVTDDVNITVKAALPQPVCSNDNFENNNTPASAASINTGLTIQAKICPLTDVDFFKFNNRNNQKNIRITLSNAPANYVLELFAPNGSLVAISNAANTVQKVIVFNNGDVGVYRVRVSAGVGAVATNNSYSLLAETSKNIFSQAGSRQFTNAEQAVDAKLSQPTTFIIYPNPATDIVYVTMPTDVVFSSLSILNQSGQLIKKITTKKGINAVPVAELKPGLYIFRVTTDEGKIYQEKVMVSQ